LSILTDLQNKKISFCIAIYNHFRPKTNGSSNNFWGIKWNVEGGTFSFTLDGDYEVGTIPVLAKSSTYYNTDEIKGPVCPGEAGGFPE